MAIDSICNYLNKTATFNLPLILTSGAKDDLSNFHIKRSNAIYTTLQTMRPSYISNKVKSINLKHILLDYSAAHEA